MHEKVVFKKKSSRTAESYVHYRKGRKKKKTAEFQSKQKTQQKLYETFQ